MVVTDAIAQLPAKYKGMIVHKDGHLYLQKDLANDLAIDSFLSRMQRQWALAYEWVDSKFLREVAQSPIHLLETESDVQNYAIKLFRNAYDMGVSDIHITDRGSKATIAVRRMGLVQEHEVLNGEVGRRLVIAIFQNLAQATTASAFNRVARLDGRIVNKAYLPDKVHSVRLHTEPIEATEGTGTFMALRLLYDSTDISGSLQNRLLGLGYTPSDAAKIEFLTQRTGLCIISGPTGSGKSTALKHVMDGMAEQSPEKNYMSVEDPPEYPMEHVKQVVVSTADDKDHDGFSRSDRYMDALSGSLRSDLDVLMVGEIRHPETASATIQATLSGHGVWATIHALNAINILTRFEGLLAKEQTFNLDTLCNHEVVSGLIYQRLIPKLCPSCKVNFETYRNATLENKSKLIRPEVLERLLSVIPNMREANVHMRGPGCPDCDYIGFKGQTVVAEVIVTDAQLLGYVRERKLSEAMKYWKETYEGRTYIDHAIDLIAKGDADPQITEMRLGVPLNFTKAMESLSRH